MIYISNQKGRLAMNILEQMAQAKRTEIKARKLAADNTYRGDMDAKWVRSGTILTDRDGCAWQAGKRAWRTIRSPLPYRRLPEELGPYVMVSTPHPGDRRYWRDLN